MSIRYAGLQVIPMLAAAGLPAYLPLLLLFAAMQSNIETTGYRSLKEGEEVEFDLVVADDGKKKAFRVTGPGGAPPQVLLSFKRDRGACVQITYVRGLQIDF